MRTIPWLVLTLTLSFSNSACRDGGLEVPGGGDLAEPRGRADLGSRNDAGLDCAAYTDAPSCRAHPECEAAACPACAGKETFFGCYDKGAGPSPICPAIACATGCELYGSQTSCDQAAGCTSLFNDPGTCDCSSPGCCLHFDRCVSTPVACSPAGIGPSCPTIPNDCGPTRAPVFEGACQIGCVRAALCESDCRSTGCTGGLHCDLCWTDWICMPAGNAC